MVRISTMFYVENVSKCVTEGSLKAKKAKNLTVKYTFYLRVCKWKTMCVMACVIKWE